MLLVVLTDRDHQDVPLQEDAVGLGCGGTVGSLSDDLQDSRSADSLEPDGKMCVCL